MSNILWITVFMIMNSIWVVKTIQLHTYKEQINTSIELCEKDLPRSIKCDYTIVSKPVLDNTEITIKELK